MPESGKIDNDTAEKLKALENVPLKGSSAGFIAEQIERYRRWGADMFMSEKQKNWVKNLYAEHVGHDEPEAAELDFRDENPF